MIRAMAFRAIGVAAALAAVVWTGARAADPPTIKLPKEIRLTDGEGPANISVGPDNVVPPGSWLGIMSLETQLTLSAGKPWSDRGWRVPVADLPGLKIKVKPDARGDTLLVLGLMSPDNDVLASAQVWLIVNGGASADQDRQPPAGVVPAPPSAKVPNPSAITQPKPDAPALAPTKAPDEPPLPERRPATVKTDVAETREPAVAYPAPFSQKSPPAPAPGVKRPPVEAVAPKPVEAEPPKQMAAAEAPAAVPVAKPEPVSPPVTKEAGARKPVEVEPPRQMAAVEAPAPATKPEVVAPAEARETEAPKPSAQEPPPRQMAAVEAPAPAAKPEVVAPEPKDVEPPKPVEAVAAPVAQAAPTLPANDASPALDAAAIKGFLFRGQQQLALGNIVGARLFLKRAAEAGSAEAALILGDTYDAGGLARLGTIGVAANAVEARRWYEKARELGAAELAAARIERMQR